MPRSADFKKNRLLSVLPDNVYQVWHKHLEMVQLPLGHVLYGRHP
jgi:hypothetical protein